MKTAIVLFNLGGPDNQEAVQPFLFNLFSDPAIISVPQPMRWLIAKIISTRRAPVAREIYQQIGGRSPIVPLTEAQARAIEGELNNDKADEYRAFIAMRYWHPRAADTARAIKAWGADRVVLLPLYPQFSTTTTGSSVKEWQKVAASAGLTAPTATIGCYPRLPELAAAQAALILPAIARAANHGRPRLLLSAHGLPEKVVKGGDPYQWQVEQTAEAVVKLLKPTYPDLDWTVCYQSRVGPLKWIGPATDEEIDRAGRDKVPLVVVPIAFVSEHSETLVELDIEYRHRASEAGVPHFERVPALATAPEFIKGLARLVRSATIGAVCNSGNEARICPPQFGACPCRAGQ